MYGLSPVLCVLRTNTRLLFAYKYYGNGFVNKSTSVVHSRLLQPNTEPVNMWELLFFNLIYSSFYQKFLVKILYVSTVNNSLYLLKTSLNAILLVLKLYLRLHIYLLSIVYVCLWLSIDLKSMQGVFELYTPTSGYCSLRQQKRKILPNHGSFDFHLPYDCTFYFRTVISTKTIKSNVGRLLLVIALWLTGMFELFTSSIPKIAVNLILQVNQTLYEKKTFELVSLVNCMINLKPILVLKSSSKQANNSHFHPPQLCHCLYYSTRFCDNNGMNE